jgi:hypothetical protein
MSKLHYIVNEAILSANQKKEENLYDSDDSDPEVNKHIKANLFCGILPQEKQNEKEAWLLMQAQCLAVLNGYPNTLEEDAQILAD